MPDLTAFFTQDIATRDPEIAAVMTQELGRPADSTIAAELA